MMDQHDKGFGQDQLHWTEDDGDTEWIAVISSNVEAFGYDKKQKLLFTRFIGGGEYTYFDVPPEVFQDAICWESPGKFVHYVLTPGYRYGPS